MNNRLGKRKFITTAISVIMYIGLVYSQDCSEGYTYFSELPETATIMSDTPGVVPDSCLYIDDLGVLNDIISANSLDYPDPINVGNQTWKYGRLTGLVASYEPNGSNGVNAQLTVLPESFGNFDSLAVLYLEWNGLTSLPTSFSQLTNLAGLTINNNWLTSLPSDFGNLNQLIFLDLGFNQLASVPESICQLENLQYLWLFNNQLESVPDCMCNLNIDWSGFDGGGYPNFGIGANHLCDNVPLCIENSANFELTLDQFYYSISEFAPQECCPDLGDINGDGNWNVLDIVMVANCVLEDNCPAIEYGCVAGDLNEDGGYNVLDIVALANCVLADTCGG